MVENTLNTQVEQIRSQYEEKQPTELDALKALDAPLILSSDSHHADTLDCAFPETKAMLRDIGFRKLMTLTDTGFVPYDI